MKVGGHGAHSILLMWFLDSYTLQDIVDPVPFGLIPLSLFAGSFYLVWNGLGRQKTVVIVICYLMLAAVPYIAMTFRNCLSPKVSSRLHRNNTDNKRVISASSAGVNNIRGESV